MRFAASPVPLVAHIVAAVGFAVLGPFQFSARLRRSGWHRRAGRILVALGLMVALSGLWMTVAYPRKQGTGELLYLARLLAGSQGVSLARVKPERFPEIDDDEQDVLGGRYLVRSESGGTFHVRFERAP